MFDIYKMFEAGTLMYVYLLILLLIVLEFWIRKKMDLGTISHTPALTVGWAVMMVRTTILLFALPLLHPWGLMILVFMGDPFLQNFSSLAPSVGSLYYYFKIIMFALWIILVILKAFFEYKYLNVKSAVVTMIFAIPIIGMLYIIYTFMF